MNKMLFISLLWLPGNRTSQPKHQRQREKKAELVMVKAVVDNNYQSVWKSFPQNKNRARQTNSRENRRENRTNWIGSEGRWLLQDVRIAHTTDMSSSLKFPATHSAGTADAGSTRHCPSLRIWDGTVGSFGRRLQERYTANTKDVKHADEIFSRCVL